MHGANCVPLQLGRFKCKCLPGWTGPTCAINIDDCADNPCALGAKCIDLVNDFHCECPPGFRGKRCHEKIDLCAQDPCQHGLCVDALHSQQCICDAGWTGALCEVNIDDCATQPCFNGATCKDQVDGFLCQCAPGFHGFLCQHMTDHCATSPCRNNATCINQGAHYRCECSLGFEGTHCEHNINECDLEQQCSQEGTELCEDLINGFKCYCRPGFVGDLCDIRINQCMSEPCLNNGTCVDVENGPQFQCECPRGWRGERCEFEDGLCALHPCRNEGHCVNLVGDYFCVCPEGVNGKNCEIAPNRCIGEPCHNGGVCGDFGSRLECTCPKDFIGSGCQYELDACQENVCLNGATCELTIIGGYICHCAAGFTGKDCEINIDDCSPSPCPLAATCIDQIAGHFCQCPFNMTGANCDKVLDVNYDFHFYDPVMSASASLNVPFKLSSKAFSLSLWVQFDTPFSAGTVMAVYNSDEPNYPSKLKELIEITYDGVRLSLFDDDFPIHMHFPQNQRVNDGEWNNIILIWSSDNGTYSLIWNGVRIYYDYGYSPNRVLNINAWISLGDSVLNTANELRFVGSVSGVKMWSRVLDFEHEVPVIANSCLRPKEFYDGLVLRFSGFDKLSGKVEKIAGSQCGTKRTDLFMKNAINVMQCPEDIFVTTANKEVNVTWEEPKFSSKTGAVTVERNLKPGQVFAWGEHQVIYVAENNISSTSCVFKVHVAREFCPDLEQPQHGSQICENWGPQLKYKACSIQCDIGYEFSIDRPLFYTCADDGIWRPRPPDMHIFRYPQCSKAYESVRLAILHVSYPAVSVCSVAGRSTLAEKLSQRIVMLDRKLHICSRSGENGCEGFNVTVRCVTSKDEGQHLARLRRQSEPEFDVQITIPIKTGLVDDPRSTHKIDAKEAIRDDVLLSDIFDLEEIIPNGRPDLNSFTVEDSYECPTGQVAIGTLCVPCSPGTYFDEVRRKCIMCPVGDYQSSDGQSRCESCPRDQITTGPGSTRQTDCKPKCPSGHMFNMVTGTCETCGYGFYQPDTGSFSCIPCGIGKTTVVDTATSEDECRDECEDGKRFVEGGTCEPCPQGTFRTKGVHKTCVRCPEGTTTEGTSAVNRLQCNTPLCTAGQFLVLETKQCQYCPRGTYQNENQQTTCKLCPQDHTTAAQGAVRSSQCYSTNQCATGEDDCSWHAICIDLPDENDIPSFQCKCKPGYKGNGTHCLDACTNFCLNDGICKKNPIGYVECICKENFSGERCEMRFQPRAWKVALITAGIGGVVTVLVITVIIIWMISYRFNRITETTEPEKLPVEDTNQSNFMYGRMSLDHPRPVGYYYEDDDEYDMKTMYVGEDGKDVEELVRHVQAHMYTPNAVQEE